MFWLFLITGQDPTSTAIMMNGGDTLEQCQVLGREKIAALDPVTTWSYSLETGKQIATITEPAEKHWRFVCVKR